MEYTSQLFTVGVTCLAPEGAATPVKPACAGLFESPQGDFTCVDAVSTASRYFGLPLVKREDRACVIPEGDGHDNGGVVHLCSRQQDYSDKTYVGVQLSALSQRSQSIMGVVAFEGIV